VSHRVHQNPHLIFSAGTQVVTLRAIFGEEGRMLHPRGAVGVVVRSPGSVDGSYRVRFVDGVEESFARSELQVLAQFKEGEIGCEESAAASGDLEQRLIYRCVTGSRAYGLEVDESDTDYRGIFLPSAEAHWSLFGIPTQIERHETQVHYWELQRFLVLALKANPNVLECLYTPLVEKATPLASELLDMRAGFLSQLVYQTFNGYVMSQFKKMQADLRNAGQVKWKHVMHLIRLLIAGVRILREGWVPVRVEEHREQLLAIRRGEVPWQETEQLRLTLHREFDRALESTNLPERPDYDRANAFLIRARRAALTEELP
jgi:hypothetical protein